jgi:hypothetical protein
MFGCPGCLRDSGGRASSELPTVQLRRIHIEGKLNQRGRMLKGFSHKTAGRYHGRRDGWLDSSRPLQSNDADPYLPRSVRLR